MDRIAQRHYTAIASDQLLEAHDLAREIWITIEVARVRDLIDTPELHAIGQAAWAAWGRFQRDLDRWRQ